MTINGGDPPILSTSTATVFGQARWPTHKSAKEAAAAIVIEEQRLLDLTDAQFAPHWRVDGGPPQFAMGELREWASRELLQKYTGKSLDIDLQIVFEAGEANPRDVPRAIQDLEADSPGAC